METHTKVADHRFEIEFVLLLAERKHGIQAIEDFIVEQTLKDYVLLIGLSVVPFFVGSQIKWASVVWIGRGVLRVVAAGVAIRHRHGERCCT